jgi:hypothetical protein
MSMSVFKLDDPNGNTIGTIRAVFPKTIFCENNVLSSDYILSLKTLSEKLVRENSTKDTALNVLSTHKTNNLVNYDEYGVLSDKIISKAKGYAEAIGYCSKTQLQNLKIVNMWVNQSNGGDFVFPHVHTNSDLTGVFYIDAPTNAIITFYDNIYNMSKDVVTVNMFSSRYFQHPCTPNSLLLFKSDLLHGNEKQPTGSKLAISFNIVF